MSKKNFKKGNIVIYYAGGTGVVKWANKRAVVVKFENGDYALFDQEGKGIDTVDSESISHPPYHGF